MELGIKGKVAIVTGGSRGIGRAIAEELAAEGVNLAIAAQTGVELATAATETCSGRTGRSWPWRPISALRTAFGSWSVHETLSRFGKVDILINFAGSIRGGSCSPNPMRSGTKIGHSNSLAISG